MVVGGAGGAAGMLLILGLLNPIFVTIILINLGFFGSINRKKIGWMVLCYFIILLIEVFPIYFYREKYVDFSAWLYLITFLFLFPLSFFTWGRRRKIKRIIYIVIAFFVIIITFVHTQPKIYYVNKNLEKELVAALDLKLKFKDSTLLSSRFLHINGDTLYGICQSYITSSSYDMYFVRNLADGKFGYDIEVSRNYYHDIGFKNGNFYQCAGDIKGSFLIKKTDTNGRDSLFCKNEYVDGMGFNGTKTFNYKNLVVVNTLSKIIFYNEKLHKVLKIDSGIMLNNSIDNKLYFYQVGNSSINLKCLDLNNLTVLWQKQLEVSKRLPNPEFERTNIDSSNEYYPVSLSVANKQISFLTRHCAYLFNMQNGNLKWKKAIQIKDINGYDYTNAKLLSDKEHSFLNVNDILYCWSIKSGQLKWKFNNIRLIGLNKGKVLSSSLNERNLFVIDIETGRIRSKIQNSERPEHFRFIDKYMLINRGGVGCLYE